ncbi:MAG: hypothetical protein U0610_00535 [bacterium]
MALTAELDALLRDLGGGDAAKHVAAETVARALDRLLVDAIAARLGIADLELALGAARGLHALGRAGREVLARAICADLDEAGADGWALALVALDPTEPGLIGPLVARFGVAWRVGPFCGREHQAREQFAAFLRSMHLGDLERLLTAMFPEPGFSDPYWIEQLARVLGAEAMVELLPWIANRARDDGWDVLSLGMVAYECAGPRAEALVPLLIERVSVTTLERDGAFELVIRAVGRVGAAAVPAVLELLANRDEGLREVARDCLRAMRVLGRTAIPPLEAALPTAKDPRCRAAIESALGRARVEHHPVNEREARELLEAIERGSLDIVCLVPELLAERCDHATVRYRTTTGWLLDVYVRYTMQWRRLSQIVSPDGRIASAGSEQIRWLGTYHPGAELARLRYGLDA